MKKKRVLAELLVVKIVTLRNAGRRIDARCALRIAIDGLCQCQQSPDTLRADCVLSPLVLDEPQSVSAPYA